MTDPASNPTHPSEQTAGTNAPASGHGDFGEIYAEYGRQVYYVALRLLGDPALAEDATHDVFVKVFKSLDKFRGDSCIRTWLYRITMNHCQNLLKSWQQRNVFSQQEELEFDSQAGTGDDPLEVLETEELGKRIQQTLDRLPLEYRKLLLLVADEELSYDQIAEITGQSVDAVRGKLHRARKAFGLFFRQTS